MKKCTKCKKLKELTEFSKHPSYKDGRRSHCKSCNNKYAKELRQTNDKFKESQKTKTKNWIKKNINYVRMKGREYNKNPNNKKRIALNKRKSMLMRKYGLTLSKFNEIWKSQGCKCAICGRSKHMKDKKRNFHVDHDHETNVVRGILCSWCNLWVGWLVDDKRLETVIEYKKRNVHTIGEL
jgi:hypothetical protein